MIRRMLPWVVVCLAVVSSDSSFCWADGPIAVGSKIVPLASAPLMDASEELLTVAKGTTLIARKTEGKWVLVRVEQDGVKTPGWIASKHLGRYPETPERIWVISTRRAPICSSDASRDAGFHYWLLGADNQWLPSDRKQFLAADDPDVSTCFFAHGNRTDRQGAVKDAWLVFRDYKKLAQGKPFRFVIWSWPSNRIGRRNRPDVQIKAARADLQSYYLANLLNEIEPNVSVSLVGYSFGARAIVGASHMLGGGRVAGRGLPSPVTERTGSMRAVLVAAAMGCDWLLEGHRNGMAMAQFDRVLITRNASDNALRWYSRMYCRRGPQALGYVGPSCPRLLGEARQKVETLDVTSQVGKSHDWTRYFFESSLRKHLDSYAFFNDAVTNDVQPEPEVIATSQPLRTERTASRRARLDPNAIGEGALVLRSWSD